MTDVFGVLVLPSGNPHAAARLQAGGTIAFTRFFPGVTFHGRWQTN